MTGPVKIQNTGEILKKPQTPDSSKMNQIRNTKMQNMNMNFGMKKNFGQLNYNRLQGMNMNNMSNINNINNARINAYGLKRPSTAPHKDKVNKPFKAGNNAINGFRPSYMANMHGPMKRVPSPMLQSHNAFSKTQKIHPAQYRVPSPLLKPNVSSELFKRNKFGYN